MVSCIICESYPHSPSSSPSACNTKMSPYPKKQVFQRQKSRQRSTCSQPSLPRAMVWIILRGINSFSANWVTIPDIWLPLLRSKSERFSANEIDANDLEDQFLRAERDYFCGSIQSTSDANSLLFLTRLSCSHSNPARPS